MPILQNQIKPAEFARNLWSVTTDAKLEDILKPEAWVHIAKNFRSGDRIEVSDIGKDWFAELMVRSVSAVSVRVAVMRFQDFTAQEGSIDQDCDMEVIHRGRAGWSVLRKSDKAVMFDKGQSREEAESEMLKLKAA